MLFLRQPALWADWRIDIRATDISDSALASARRGVYSNFEVQRGLGVTEMLNFFDDTPAGWRVRPAVMRNIRFTRHNLLDAPPMLGAFDLVLCRNVLLYLQRDARARVAANLASSMKHGGILLVGGGEVVSGAEGLLAPMENAAGFYTRRAVPAAPGLRKSA
jgi:chemotaxis protein methyltransferase CheR